MKVKVVLPRVQALYLLGVQLLTVDETIPGDVRERLLVSYYRYAGHGTSHVDTVSTLLRSTGYVAGAKRPVSYPETLFSRVSVPAHIVNKVSSQSSLTVSLIHMFQIIGRLRSDDLYHLLSHYPDTGERSTGHYQHSPHSHHCIIISSSVSASIHALRHPLLCPGDSQD